MASAVHALPSLGSVVRVARVRPTLAQLGLHRLGGLLLALSLLMALVGIGLAAGVGLAIPPTLLYGEVGLAVTGGVWLLFALQPGGSPEWFVAEWLFVLSLLVLCSEVVSAFQYSAVALGRPYADGWLAAADAAIGVHVPHMAAWTRAHPRADGVLRAAYATLAPQFLGVLVVLGVCRDRASLWEFAFHYHVCLVVAVVALLMCPAVCPPAYYSFASTIDMTRVIRQIQGLHDGTLRVLPWRDIDGLVSFPSFHVVGALIVLWAVRDRRWLLVPLAVLNVVLIAATVLTGVHYAIDVIASGPLVLGSVWLYRRYAASWRDQPLGFPRA